MNEEVERIRRKLQSNQYALLLQRVDIDGLRGFNALGAEINFPVTAIVGENGSGKTTLLKAAACAYEQEIPGTPTYQPGKFFMATAWDKVQSVKLSYVYKHGKETRTHSLRKPTDRWRGMPERPKRRVYLLDISRTMPLEGLMGYAQIAKRTASEAESTDLPDDYRARLSYILNRDYEQARFATSDADKNRQVGVLRQTFGDYSQFHQGAGESASLDLVRILERIPRESLLLIDEVEASLHPKAQRRLMETLLWLSRTKNIQVILTTHSPYVLDELPPESRILLLRGKGGVRAVYGASTEFCLTSIDDRQHAELNLFCEDKASEAIIRELIAHEDADILARCSISRVGASDVVETMARLANANLLPYAGLGIIDADTSPQEALALPGNMPPEKQLFNDLKNANWPDLAQRFGVGFGDLGDILEEAMLVPDHHKWCSFVGDRIRRTRSYVLDTLTSVWVARCVAPEMRVQFVQEIKDRLKA